MPSQQSRGICQLCGETFTKGGMSNHLRACVERAGSDAGGNSVAISPLFHLSIQDRYGAGYWLHLEMPVFATLGLLDLYLRDIWLECCGHLSEFTIDDMSYSSYPDDGLGFAPAGESMFETTLSSVLAAGSTFRHSYDFGSTTELAGRVVAERDGRLTANSPVRLLARNLPPQYPCSECGEPAAWSCSDCLWDGKGFYCQACGQNHDCEYGGWEMLMPVVNSPRTGVCGYTGGPLT
jgi:predicted RNA-binding Zn-ribbon protein involved in translation (DUF1610 family)